MKLARIHIATILLIIGFCEAKTSGRDLSKVDNPQNYTSSPDNEFLHTDEIEDTNPEAEILKEEQSQDDLPILPPIILLDFGNGTDNENTTSEEKSKRTVNNGIGYGLGKNSLQPGRYNYYYPGGKTGTTVSIEESISPFLPKTIIEKFQPNQRNVATRPYGSHQNLYNAPSSIAQSHSHSSFQYLNPELSSKSSVFGLRTKLHKAPISSNYESYQNFLSTPKPPVSPYGVQNSGYRGNVISTTTSSPLAYSPTEQTKFATVNPLSYAGSRGNSFNYGTSNPYLRQSASSNSQTYTAQRQNIQSDINPQGFGYHTQHVESSTVSPVSYNAHYSRPASLSNTPRYTIENGVRYENKIFWKYPDGRVSDVPPATYETYSEHPQSSMQQAGKSQSPFSVYEAGSAENGVLSQGPVQFPAIPEASRQEAGPFISSDSLSSSLPQQQVYRLGYQNLVTQKQNANLAQRAKPTDDVATSYSFASSALTSKASPNKQKVYGSSYSRQQTVSKYMVNSPNPEYTDVYTTEPTVNTTTPISKFYTPSGELSPHISSKYTPKVQNYLRTVFAAGEDSRKQNLGSNDLDNYSNLQYSDLLNYNPSISQYVRNPASILNVQPTFVQAGNSLIPVIILRVDGASPIQPKVTPNINLKALLQQYLIQYANSIQELARPSSYDLGTESIEKTQNSVSNRSPLLDLIRLTQNDAREAPSYTSNAYTARPSYESSNFETAKTYASNKYGSPSTGQQKVKNVQILEDPRYASYKIKN